MSIFGKVLAVLNILAAGAFVFLATQARGTRHAWQLTAWHHQRALEGQPLNNDEKDIDGDVAAQKPTDATLRVVFPDGPVRTLEEEVNRRRGDLSGMLEKPEVLEALLLTARTEGERHAIREQIRKGEAKQVLDQAFNAALSTELNPDARRQAIAYLLIAVAEVRGDLNATEQNLRRVYTVVGVRHYTRAMVEHADNLRLMTERVREFIAQDQGDFVLRHDTLVRQLLVMAGQIEDLRRHLRLLGEQKTDNYEPLVKARLKDLEDLSTELTAINKARDTELSRQGGLEKQLFAFQRKLSEAADRNLRLEQDIRKLELGR